MVLNPLDEDVADLLRRTNKKVFLVANKVDNNARMIDINDFYSLGLGEIYCISSINGMGTGDLLDKIVEEFETLVEDESPDLPKIAIVGRPNVGKSSIINAFIGVERNIVTPIAGTTRDSVYTPYNSFGFNFLLVDTAGLRKKSKVFENIEFYSVMRSIRAIENSDVCVLMLDATAGLESQDINIFSLAEKNRKGVVIVVNKWIWLKKKPILTKNTKKRFVKN